MGHQLSALIGKAAVNSVVAKAYDIPVVELPQGFSLIALDVAHSDHWTEEIGIKQDAEEGLLRLDNLTTHFFAGLVFGANRFAVIETDYHGGTGSQTAVVYEDGAVLMPAVSARRGPINQALELLGVAAASGQDGFQTLGLNLFRSYGDVENY